MAVACVVDPLDPSTPIRLMVAGSGLQVFKSYEFTVHLRLESIGTYF